MVCVNIQSPFFARKNQGHFKHRASSRSFSQASPILNDIAPIKSAAIRRDLNRLHVSFFKAGFSYENGRQVHKGVLKEVLKGS